MLFEFYRYIKTEFVLLIHYDGFVVNPEMWRPEFLDYDYIGSPWPDGLVKDIYGNSIRVGNGVSLRSKKLSELPKTLNLPFQYGEGLANNEDSYITGRYRHIFLQNSIKYAPLEIAKYFGHCNMIPEIKGIRPFLFHYWSGSNEHYKNFERFHLVKSFLRKLPWVIKRIEQYGLKKAIKYYFIKYIMKGDVNKP